MLHSCCRLIARQVVLNATVYNAYSTSISIPLGITIGLLASFVQSLGLTIQRKSHVLNQSLPEHQQRVEHRRPLWVLGLAIFISSNILGSFVQIASLPVVILAPLGAVSLLWNAFFARLILGDVFSPWMILGTVLIAGGAVLIAIFGIVPEPTRSLEDLLMLFNRPTFIIYFSILGAVVLACLSITHIADYSFSHQLSQIGVQIPSSPPGTYSTHPLPSSHGPTSTLTTGLTTPAAEASITERTPLLDPKRSSIPPFRSQDPAIRSINHTRLLLAISYASFSGIISGMCLLFAKSGVELLLLTLRGKNQFWRWQAWMLVLGLVVFALLQLWYLHKALVLADPTLVCPSAFCFYNLSSIVNGLVYFNQFSLIPPLHLGLVALGIFVLLGGVWVVSVQSGGGDTDLEDWGDSDDSDNGNNDNTGRDTRPADISDDDLNLSTDGERQRMGPFPMERETRSESHIHDLSRSPVGLGLDMGPTDTLPPHLVVSQSARSNPSLFTEGSRFAPSVGRRVSHLRRTTLDYSSFSSSSQHGRGYTHQIQTSPPLLPINTVSTLGGGFQIGLSPVSPGFAIVPRERGRRTSGLGLEGEHRRRTVSESSVRRRVTSESEDVPKDRWKWLKQVLR